MKNTQKTTKAQALKQMLTSPGLAFIMEAHSGLSAKIAEEAGFQGLWASGLSISASYGVRDNNEASWTQVLETLEFMSDATRVPILLDGDTGYGNFNNMMRLVKKLEQREIAGVCIEDKLFPKTNSFIAGEAQPLADIDEFCGKIKAGKDAQKDDSFCVVARVEAFIAGWGLSEALRRAEAYRKAGADAILVHSKKSTPSDIEDFMKEWGNRHPIVIVPTKYYSTPTEWFEQIGISLVIWANHQLRASVKAMQTTTKRIFEDQSLKNVEDKVAPLKEIFRLQDDEELRVAEERYLPKRAKQTNAIILAASRGEEMGSLTVDKPKAMIEVGGRAILDQLIGELNKLSIKDVTVVRGFKKEAVRGTNFIAIDNDRYAETKDLSSLYLAKHKLTEHTIISYGDTLFRNYILADVLNFEDDIVIVVDANQKSSQKKIDYVVCNKPYTNDFFHRSIALEEIHTGYPDSRCHGEWVGLLCVNNKGATYLSEAMNVLKDRPDFDGLTVVDLLNEVRKNHPVAVTYIRGGWVDVDEARDLEEAGEFYA
jgi:phosphoenolpyruvate phosphomutase